MRVVHHLNQFFGGLGGEEKAGTALEVREGAVGPGKLFEQLLGPDAHVVLTLICGDNYAVENQEALIAWALEKIREAKADLLVAGPCFLAGRYGMAAGALCQLSRWASGKTMLGVGSFQRTSWYQSNWVTWPGPSRMIASPGRRCPST